MQSLWLCGCAVSLLIRTRSDPSAPPRSLPAQGCRTSSLASLASLAPAGPRRRVLHALSSLRPEQQGWLQRGRIGGPRLPWLRQRVTSSESKTSMPAKKPFTFRAAGQKGGCKPGKIVAKPRSRSAGGSSEHARAQAPAATHAAQPQAVDELQQESQVDLAAHAVTASLMVANDERQLQCTRSLLGHANELRRSLMDLNLINATMTVECTAASSAMAASRFLVQTSEQTCAGCRPARR